MIGDLLEFHQRTEDQPLVFKRTLAFATDTREHLVDDGLVQCRLLGREVTENFHLVLFRQVTDDRALRLEAAQDERPRDLTQNRRTPVGAVAFDRHGEMGTERTDPAKEPSVEEIHDRPQLDQAILDGGARQAIPVATTQ